MKTWLKGGLIGSILIVIGVAWLMVLTGSAMSSSPVLKVLGLIYIVTKSLISVLWVAMPVILIVAIFTIVGMAISSSINKNLMAKKMSGKKLAIWALIIPFLSLIPLFLVMYLGDLYRWNLTGYAITAHAIPLIINIINVSLSSKVIKNAEIEQVRGRKMALAGKILSILAIIYFSGAILIFSAFG